MTDRVDENAALSIQEQAAEWFIRWHSGEVTVAERYAYLQWLKTSPVHIAELLRVCQMYACIGAMKLPLYYTNEDTFTNVVEFKPRETTSSEETRGLATWRSRLAAGVAIFAVAVLFGGVAKVAWFDRTLETQPGEWQIFTLTDGTIVRAGPRTEMRHTFGDERRLVRLERGRAVFQVAKDPTRPFIVDAEFARIKATGTQFEVRHVDEEEIRVVVSEGSVDVVRGDGAGAEVVSLEKDQKVTVSSEGITPVEPSDVSRDLAWVGRWLDFREETVKEAVAEFNDMNDVQIVVSPQSLKRAVRGAFAADDPESFADALAARLEGRVDRSKPNVLRIETPGKQR
jgi:transmembrane sensor